MYTQQQIQTVINYNNTARIFNVTQRNRITWDVRNVDVANLQQQGVRIVTQADFAQLKKQVKQTLQDQQA